MQPIKGIVSDLIGKMSSQSGGYFQDIQAAWAKVSKDQGSKVTDFKEGTLTISADSSLRLVRLNLHREQLLKELQKQFPAVVKINFKVESK